MKIGFDVSMIFGSGGIQRYVRELIAHMVPLSSPFTYKLLTRPRRLEEIHNIIKGNAAEVLPVLPHNLALGPLLTNVTRAVLRRRWKKHAADIDLVHFHEGGRWLPPVKKFVVTIHDLFPIDDEIATDGLVRKSFPIHIKPMIERSERIIVPSEYVRTTFMRHFPDAVSKIRVIPLAAADDFAIKEIQKPADSTPYVLWVGRLDLRKNLGRILHAWTLLPAALQLNCKLILVGPWDHTHYGTDHKDVEQLIHSTGIELRSHISNDEYKQLLANACGLIFPSIAEGFGLPVLEAMKCRCPVLTSNTSSLPEVAGDAAIIVDPYDVKGIRDGIEALLTNAALRDELREKGVQRAGEFSWTKTAHQTLDVYREALGV